MKNVTKLQIVLILIILGLAYLKFQATDESSIVVPSSSSRPMPSLPTSPDPLQDLSPLSSPSASLAPVLSASPSSTASPVVSP